MKKHFIFLLSFLFSVVFFKPSAQAQVNMDFAPDHAEWWNFGGVYGGAVSYFNYYQKKVTGDTVIQNIPAKIISERAYILNRSLVYGNPEHPNNPTEIHWSIDSSNIVEHYIYANDDTVFIFNDHFNRFTTLMVFNVGEGDTVCLPIPPNAAAADLMPNPIANGDTCYCYRIDSIRTVLYDTTYLETFYTTGIANAADFDAWPVYNFGEPLSGGEAKGIYARKLGGLYGHLLPYKMELAVAKPTQDTLTFNDQYLLRCYMDNEITIKLSQDIFGNECRPEKPDNSIVGIQDVEANKEHDYNIFPNPAHAQITISSSQLLKSKTKVVMMDIAGRILLAKQWTKDQSKINISLEGFAPGLYIVKIEDEKSAQYQKLIVK